MGHTITFHNPGAFQILSTDEITDLINFFYRWKDTKFRVVCDDNSRTRRGAHLYMHPERMHQITLSAHAMSIGFHSGLRMGGNGPAPSLRMGAAMVVAHELQHANQAGQHLANERFYTHRDYNTRPCEREARSFVDSHMRELMTMVAPELLQVHIPVTAMCADQDGIGEVVGLFEGLSEVTVTDIRTELRLSGMNTVKNFEMVRDQLVGLGIRIR